MALTQNELEHHSLIMMEHCAFIHMGVEVEPDKQHAFEQYEAWRQFIQNGHPLQQLPALLHRLKSFKQTLLQRLAAGEWLGFVGFSFMRHILEELLEFELLLNGQRPSAEVQAVQAHRLMSDHLEEAEGKFDPLEVEFKAVSQQLIADTPDAIKQLAHRDVYNVQQEYQAAVTELAREHGQAQSDLQFFIGLSLTAGEQINRLLGDVREQKPKSVLHERLLDHWLREGHHMLEELSLNADALT